LLKIFFPSFAPERAQKARLGIFTAKYDERSMRMVMCYSHVELRTKKSNPTSSKPWGLPIESDGLLKKSSDVWVRDVEIGFRALGNFPGEIEQVAIPKYFHDHVEQG